MLIFIIIIFIINYKFIKFTNIYYNEIFIIGARIGQLQSIIGLITIIKNYEISLNSKCKGDLDVRNIFITPINDFSLNLTKI